MAGLTIDEKTRVNLYLAGVAVCFAFWVGIAYSLASDAKVTNDKQDQKLEALNDIKVDIAVIKKMLENNRGK